MLDVTSPFLQRRWLEEHKNMSTTYNALRVSFAQDSSLLVTSFTSWTIRSWFARQTMRLQRPGVSVCSTIEVAVQLTTRLFVTIKHVYCPLHLYEETRLCYIDNRPGQLESGSKMRKMTSLWLLGAISFGPPPQRD